MSKKLVGVFVVVILIGGVLFALTKSDTENTKGLDSKSVEKNVKQHRSKVANNVINNSNTDNKKRLLDIKVDPEMEAKKKKYAKIMELSGVPKDGMKKMMMNQLAKKLEKHPELKKIFENYDIDEEIREAMLSELSLNELEDIVDFYSDPIVKDISKISMEMATNPDKIMQMQEYMKSFDESKINQERQDIVNDILKTQNSVELADSIVDATIRASAAAMVDGSYEEQNVMYEKLKQGYTQRINQTPGGLERQIKSSLYYSYQDVSDEKLKAYADRMAKSSLHQLNEKSVKITGKAIGKYLKHMFEGMKQIKKE